MPRIITNVQTAPVPGFWQRLAALQADSDAGDGLDLVRQLETMNIPGTSGPWSTQCGRGTHWS